MNVKRVDLQNGAFRVTVTVSEPVRDENDLLAGYHRLFDQLGSNPRLLACDLELPQKITIISHPDRWQVDAVAIVRAR